MDLINKINTINDNTELLALFDQVSYTLGFSNLSIKKHQSLDTELALLLSLYLADKPSLKLKRFVGVTLAWLEKYHKLINSDKLKKIGTKLEQQCGELPLFRLACHVLLKLDPRKFKRLKPKPLREKYYLDTDTKDLVELDLEEEGFFYDLPETLNLRLSKNSFKIRSMDLIPQKSLLQRNGQLKFRLLLGTSFRADILFLLKKNPQLRPKDVVKQLPISYEPAHRILNEVQECLEYKYAL